MTVKCLIAKLSKLDPNRLVVLSSDMEGNSFSPLAHIEKNLAFNAERAEIGVEKKIRGYDDEPMTDGVPAVVLFP